jgi:glucan phosphoethanolaminetransferase (alkaline phosphatase superfamily)
MIGTFSVKDHRPESEVFPERAAPALLVLCAPLVALSVWLTRVDGLQSLAALWASILLAMLLVAVCARSWRRFFLIQFPVMLLSSAFATYTLIYGTVPGDVIAYVIATSSWDEFRGFFSIWQGQLLLLAAIALTAIYVIAALLTPRRPIFPGGNTRTRLGLPGTVVALSAFAAIRPVGLIEGLATNPVIGTALFIGGPLARARASVQGDAVAKVSYGASRTHTEEVHILVIGESARRDSWSVYGYQRKTTPYLEKLRNEAVFFGNAVTDANFTVYAVPILLTGMRPGHFAMGNIKGNLVDLAKEGGYSTAWLMNQDPHISLLTGIHADLMVYPPSISTLVDGHLPLDQSLLPELRAQFASTGVARFVGVHVIGSHWEYDSRYPAAFERFGSTKGLNYQSVFSWKSDPRVLDAYDSSVAYTDWFLEQLIEQARKLSVPATGTYFADHGEDLYALDGNTGHGTATYSKHQFDIPAFVWMNSAYRKAHPDKVQAIMGNADKEIRTHNVFYSMADLMGIHWPGAISSAECSRPREWCTRGSSDPSFLAPNP